jgi:hypothetical protein
MMGVRSITVYAGFGNVPSGAFSQPTKTMFQTALPQLPHVLLRDSHCCCDAGTILPSTTESARNPPLAQPAFHFESNANRCNSPLTCSRRSGAACETAMRVMFLLSSGVTAKFSSVRQKLHVAFAFGIQLAGTLTPPLICTSSGFCPRPATCV